jgi:hypothetical protein
MIQSQDISDMIRCEKVRSILRIYDPFSKYMILQESF